MGLFVEDKLLNLFENSKLIILALVTFNNVKFVIAQHPKVCSQGITASRNSIPKKKTTPILVYCNSGNKSQAAAKELQKMGYTDVTDLETGIKGWKKEGLPVV